LELEQELEIESVFCKLMSWQTLVVDLLEYTNHIRFLLYLLKVCCAFRG